MKEAARDDPATLRFIFRPTAIARSRMASKAHLSVAMKALPIAASQLGA